ncbi:TIGR03746 family integrating conjugative element protein [Corticibacter populi]|uniref:TIGR03746 family integrating conjugative element protein n=1 Tax=Corticibacter populi TaxID=1550736 RepID=A0A3M6QYP0_9BURK|nr:TIGR03746 family integrating conjugative element protein [Corticibacter populi]RMX08144.1 TIGR03746 family integrating conjugative element protein [Corticibacter populi]RZS35400.1 integrating conjugative element protein (TIGR03746 family) [Corticibacter populi]
MSYIDALETERKKSAQLVKIMACGALLGLAAMYLLYASPKHVTVHLAPDVRAGDSVDIRDGHSPVPSSNVYSFGYYIWQQVNRWQADGSKDYPAQVFALQAYLTPRCRAQLVADMETRGKRGELRQRTRLVTEIPGFGFAENRVISEGGSSWQVLLDMQLIEEFRGHSLKDVFIRYPLRVVRYDVDRQRNPWGLALDCFGAATPARINAADVAAGKPQQAPTSIAPMTLPRTTNQSVDPLADAARGPAARSNP